MVEGKGEVLRENDETHSVGVTVSAYEIKCTVQDLSDFLEVDPDVAKNSGDHFKQSDPSFRKYDFHQQHCTQWR